MAITRIVRPRLAARFEALKMEAGKMTVLAQMTAWKYSSTS